MTEIKDINPFAGCYDDLLQPAGTALPVVPGIPLAFLATRTHCQLTEQFVSLLRLGSSQC